MLLTLEHVWKHYQMGDTTIKALDDVSLEISAGEFVAVMGPSGSGKSTFLQVASMLAQPSGGIIKLKDRDVSRYDERQSARLRNREIGFIFQQFNLLPKTSALDNVSLPLIYAGIGLTERHKRAAAMLERVGLSDRLNNTPAQLSGGQQQRVAIARALINDPAIIFADEPTGNLDSKSSAEIEAMLVELHDEGKTIILVTHEPENAALGSRIIHFRDGTVTSDEKTQRTPTSGKKI